MKKFMKVISAGLSALIGMSVMTAMVSAYEILKGDYLFDENNIVWEDENGVRCYENGEMIDVGSYEYLLYIAPADGVTAEDLGVEFNDPSWRIELKNSPKNTKAVAVENIDELTALCDKAENWFDNGLITYAYGFEVINYGCVWDAGIQITLREADENYNPQEYKWLEDVEFKSNSTYDVYTISSELDNTKLPEIMAQIEADERVDTFSKLDMRCAVDHLEINAMFSLQEIIIGDITGDCSVNLYDAVEISKYVMNMIEFDEDTFALADYNADGEVNLYDVIEIAKFMMD